MVVESKEQNRSYMCSVGGLVSWLRLFDKHGVKKKKIKRRGVVFQFFYIGVISVQDLKLIT